ncbi:DUF63 family protein [Haloplanus ruber]|uniref:DUF63 family protein n=1 Tax=Haloplanus ruber TaxID=869892 RepID=A0ABD6CSX6_9EURY|nr:DUF63 family protein [Haloplanus ruber]
MALLPEGFALPPLPYLIALLAGLVAVAALLSRRRPPVTERLVLAATPWMVLGAAVHVLYVLRALPTPIRPFAGTPAVYLSVAVLAGATWLVADATARGTATLVGGVGAAVFLPVVAAVVGVGLARDTLRVAPSAGILVGTALVATGAWTLLRRTWPDVAVTGRIGALAVTGHALDGVSTAVGIDLLGFGERTPLSAVVIDFAASLPTASLLGSGWLFVLVKLVVAGGVVALLTETVSEEPTEGRLLLGFVAAVGLGPGVHNVLLFAVA